MSSNKSNIVNKVIRVLKRSIKANSKKNNLLFCPVCENNTSFSPFPYQTYFKKFYEHGFMYSPFLFETLNLKNYKCKSCKSSDRERLLSLYINKHLEGNIKKEINLIEFAPKKPLQEFLRKKPEINYRCADLNMEDVDDNVDITNMDIYKENTFDMFICSHILEHIEQDSLAMKELYRISKKDGIGLLLVPIMLSLNATNENKEYLKSEHLRWKYFGQYDHVRMYEKNDFVSRLSNEGFKVEQLGQDYFGKDVFELCGIDEKSVLYVVKK